MIVGQHRLANLVGQFLQQGVARLPAGQRPLDPQMLHENFEIDLVVAAIDPRRVIHRVGVDAAPGQGVFDAAPLGEAEIAPLPHHLGPQPTTVDTHVVVGPITDFLVFFDGRLDVGADAAIPEQIDFGGKQQSNQTGGVQGFVAHPEPAPRLGRQGDVLGLAGKDPAPF